jgi:hypothetical protein
MIASLDRTPLPDSLLDGPAPETPGRMPVRADREDTVPSGPTGRADAHFTCRIRGRAA